MKRIWLAATLVIASASAHAADLAPRPYTKAAPADRSHNWTGCYVGGNAGYDWSRADTTATATTWLASGSFTQDYIDYYQSNASNRMNLAGFTGGGQVGCNWQSKNWVVGLEGDFNYTDLSASRSTGIVPTTIGTPIVFQDSISSRWLATVRGRVGVAFDRLLVYATGGLATANVEYSTAYFLTTHPLGSGSLSETRVGWTVGAGVEYALDRNWSTKLEYLYADLGNVNLHVVEQARPEVSSDYRLHFTENLVRVGINYKFGGPVVKY
jgi:outer membrane immunogenic protein